MEPNIMSKCRMVNTRYWMDGFILKLNPSQKLLFIYFITNDKTSICGIYECPIQIATFETNVPEEEIWEFLELAKGKIHYIDGWIYVRNFKKYQSSSDAIQTGIEKEEKKVPPHILKEVQAIDKQYGQFCLFGDEGVGNNAEDVLKDQAQKIIDYYKLKIYDKTKMTKASLKMIKTRLKDKPTEAGICRFDELKKAIDNFVRDEWRMEHNRTMGLSWFFRSEEQIVKWLGLADRVGNNIKRIKVK